MLNVESILHEKSKCVFHELGPVLNLRKHRDVNDAVTWRR